MEMSASSHNQLQEDKEGRGTPVGQVNRIPPESGYPSQNANQQIGLPTSTVITRNVQVQPENYLLLSIFVFICCCLPLGIIAVIKSNEVTSRYRFGDNDGAVESSRQAKIWAMIGLLYGFVLWGIALVCLFVYIILVLNASLKAIAEGSYYN